LSRNCIDIAVKLAFGLNKFKGNIIIQEFQGTKVADLQEVEVIKEIQNTGKLGLPTSDEGWGPMRARQSSDDILRTEVNKLIRLFDGQKKVMDVYGVRDEGFELVKAIEGYIPGRENYSSDLLNLYMSSAQELVGITMETDLSGASKENEEE
jgi:hypothetical protein